MTAALTPTRRELAIAKYRLTEREIQVLTGISRGHTYDQIGRQHYITVNTVKSTGKRLFHKLRVNDRAHAVHVAHLRGILGGEA